MTGNTNTDLRTGVVGGLGAKAPCRVASFTNLILEGLQTVNGIALIEDDRVLVRSQDDATENGIYIASTGEWQRAVDFDDELDGVSGSLIAVNEGTGTQEQSPKTLWIVQCDDTPIVFGTSEISFDFFALSSDEGGGTYMLTSNNLSDVNDAATSLSNIGGQPLNANLTALSGLTGSSDKILAFDGVGSMTTYTVGSLSGNVPLIGTSSASTTIPGLIEIATDAELVAGVDTSRAVTAASIFSLFNSSSLSANGYVRLPVRSGSSFSEIIVQWGSVTNSGTSGTITLPLTYPNNNFVVVGITDDASSANNHFAITAQTLSNFTWANTSASSKKQWISIGN